MISRFKVFWITVFLFLISQEFLSGQQLILLEHRDHPKKIWYYMGEYMHLKVQDGSHIKGNITSISDSVLKINQQDVKTKDIICVYSKRWFINLISSAGMVAGMGYIGIESVNNVVNSENTIIAKRELLAGGIVFGAGAILSLFNERKCNINTKWRMKVLDFESL